MTDAEIRDVFLAHGFVVKPGFDDLKPYVYEAARALIAAAVGDSAETINRLTRERDEVRAIAAKGTEKALATTIPKFRRGDRVFKPKGSSWYGTIVGEYSTKLTPEGYAVESAEHPGSVQIYPAAALEHAGYEPPARKP